MNADLRQKIQHLVKVLEAKTFLLPKQRRLLRTSREMLRTNPSDVEIGRVATEMRKAK